ncbi:MAG TPA: dynamin family protein [Nitrosopumilaceae archaeon]|nr:dynamin family protein [Nitrosopumilaceae archaeon]
MKDEVYISYSWPDNKTKEGKVKSQVVKNIVNTLTKNKINFILDKKDVKYKDNITQFEERLGKGSKIILVVCDKFLRSRHCMFEVLKIKERGNVYNRIFPIIHTDAKINNPKDVLQYVKHWENEIKALNKEIKKLDTPANIKGISQQIDNYTKFREIIEDIISILRAMNTLSAQEHLKTDFAELVTLLKDNKIDISKQDEEAFGKRVAKTQELYESAINIVSKELKSQDNKDSDILVKLKEWHSKCISQTFQIGVMAMIKSGKSTFLNSLLGNEFLPTSNVAETAVPVRIIHTNSNDSYLLCNGKEKIEGAKDIKATLKERNKKQREKGSVKISDFRLHSNLISLNELAFSKIKFEILDTPGFGEALDEVIVGKNIEQSTSELLDQISVVIYILDYSKLKTKFENEVLEKFANRPDILEKIQDRLFLVVNRMDEQDRDSLKPEETVDYVHKLVKKQMPKINKTQIFTISAKKALLSRLILMQTATPEAKEDFGRMAFGAMATKMDQEHYREYAKTLLAESNINTVETQLIDFIYKERGRLFIETLLDNLKRYLSDFKNKFISTAQGTLGATITEIEALEKKIEEAKKKQQSIEDDAENFETEIKAWIGTEFKSFENKINDSIELLFSSEQTQHQSKFLGIKIPLWFPALQAKVQTALINSHSESRDETLRKVTKLNKEIIAQLNSEFIEFKKELEFKIFDKQKSLLANLETSINVMARDFESTVKKSLHVNLISIQLQLNQSLDFDKVQAEANNTIDRFVSTDTVEKDVPMQFEVYIKGGICRKGRFETHTSWQKIAVPEYKISRESVASFWKSSMESMANGAKQIAISFIDEQIRKQIKIARDSIDNYIGEYLSIIQYEKVRLSSGNVNAIKKRIDNLSALDEQISQILISIDKI